MVENTRTTIQVDKETLERLQELKPFESISHDEFLNHLADEYENETQ